MHSGLGEQSCHQFLDLLGNAVVVEGGADVFAGGDEVYVLFEGDGGGALGGGCEFSMQGFVRAEQRDGQLKHDLGEMTRAPLTATLQVGHTAAVSFTIEDCRQVPRLPLSASSPCTSKS